MGNILSSSPGDELVVSGASASGEASAAPAIPAAMSTGASSRQSDYYCGVNCYYLMTRAASEGCRQMVADTLDAIQRTGCTVIRTWAFNDGSGWNALQTAPGVYDENVFRGLDWVVAECGKRGLRLMMTLSNYWHDFGGFPQYVRWAKGDEGAPATGEEFYESTACQQMYRAFVAAVVGRVNTITGVAYRDDPAIFAWDIANEPRCEGDMTHSIVTRWVDSAAGYVKSLDPNHPVTVGLEGFFGPSSPDLAARFNPYNQLHGVDWVANNRSPNIDFTSIHLYADQWCPGDTDDGFRCGWSVDWVKSHVEASKTLLGKPLCLQEFGKKPAGPGRARLFEELLGLQAREASEGGHLAGSLVWMFAHESYPDYDNYTIYESGAPDDEAAKSGAQPVVRDEESMALVVACAQQLIKPWPS